MKFSTGSIRKALAFSSLLALPISASAASPEHHLTTEPTFAGIAWSSDIETVKTKMRENGFTLDSEHTAKDADHDVWFDGTVQGTRSKIIDFIDGRHLLVKTQIMLFTDDDDCERSYKAVASGLTAKYGTPTVHKANYAAPYSAGNLDFMKAVKAEKADIGDAWLSEGNDPFGVIAEVKKDLTIQIDYESAKWSAELDRRRAKPDPNL